MRVFLLVLFIIIPSIQPLCGLDQNLLAQGVAPEQIYQSAIQMHDLIGTWEVLPQDNPLDEKRSKESSKSRKILTLRKDGTCRVFDTDLPDGSDAIWQIDDHVLHVRFQDGRTKMYYVYGIRMDFMMTRSQEHDKDVLWSKIK